MTDLILKKRNGIELSKDDFEYFIKGYLNDSIPDYQVSALLMAIYFQGMTSSETIAFTESIIHSGEVLDLSMVPAFKIDKHSTGGVGDKTTIILAPLVASIGVCVTKMSGRGIGHTGGTIDKLSAIPNLSTLVSREQFIRNMQEIGIGYTQQTDTLAPADKKLYALRDVTGTVKSTPLIAASIMGKKIASGSDGIVLDVKCGRGAFMENVDEARQLAQQMVSIGKGMDKQMTAIISNMNQPLGMTIGNSVEVIEAIEVLKNKGAKDLVELTLELGGHMLLLANKTESLQRAKEILKEALVSGAALSKFEEMIHSLGGDKRVINDYSLFKQAKYTTEIIADKSGYVTDINALTLGKAAMTLGAGRKTKEEEIDPSAGIILNKKQGDQVTQGDVLAKLNTDKHDVIEQVTQQTITAFTIEPQPRDLETIVLDVIR